MRVQSRRNSLSTEWYDAPEMTPDDVDKQNREYGWKKYRIIGRMS